MFWINYFHPKKGPFFRMEVVYPKLFFRFWITFLDTVRNGLMKFFNTDWCINNQVPYDEENIILLKSSTLIKM